MANLEVDDAQPAMAQAHAIFDEKARIIGPAMGQQISRLFQVSVIDFRSDYAEYSAHIFLDIAENRATTAWRLWIAHRGRIRLCRS